MDPEAELLLDYLQGQRRHVLAALDSLTDEQMLTPVMPSGWHLIGLIKHLSLADEHYWFRCVMAGEPFDFFPEGPNADWQLDPGETVADVLVRYRDECERSDEIIRATALDAPPAQPDPMWEEWGRSFPNLRVIMLHMIVEVAAHAGHADAARELIDGKQWVVV